MTDEQFNALLVETNRNSRELKAIRELLSESINNETLAESEIPERIRRFAMYMHDVHSVSYMYTEQGLPVPPHVHREMERCDDRFRQLLKEYHSDGNAFEVVRREMAADPENRWDHTRYLTNGSSK